RSMEPSDRSTPPSLRSMDVSEPRMSGSRKMGFKLKNRPRAIVSGALANKPFNGGNAWTRLSWVCGLKNLGFDVCFLEQIGRKDVVDAAGEACVFEGSVNLAYFRSIMSEFGLSHSSALILDGGEETDGLSPAELLKYAA